MTEAAIVDGLEVYGVSDIKEVIDFFNAEVPLEQTQINLKAEFYEHSSFSTTRG